MKTIRGIAPLLVLLSGLLLVGVLAACGSQTSGTGAGQQIRPFRTEHASNRLAAYLAVSPDGQTMATATWKDEFTKVEGTDHYSTTITATVALWRLDGWQFLRSFEFYNYIHGIRFTPDGRSLVVSTGGNIEWADLADGKVTRKLTGGLYSLAFSPDWTTAAKFGPDNQVLLLRANDGSVVSTITGVTGYDGLAFSPDGQLLATTGFEGNPVEASNYKLQLWRVSGGTLVHNLAEGEALRGWSPGRIAFSPDGQILAWGDPDSNVRLYQVSDGKLLHTLDFSYLEDIAFSPDSKLVATGSALDLGKLWRVSDGSPVAELVNEEGMYGAGGKVLDVEFSPDGKIVYGSTVDGTVRMWQVPEQAAR